MAPVDAIALLARAHPPRRGHHLGHRQRAARLPHRPVPDHGARHQRQDALDRAAHERRRPVRDRRRRLGPEARAAAREGEPPPLGLASASSSPWPRRFEHLAETTGNKRAQVLADTLDLATGTLPRGEQVARPQGRRASTTAAATSTWPSTGPRRWPPRPTTPSWPPPSPRSPSGWRPTRRRSPPSSSRVQGQPADIGGYYAPDPAKATAVMRPSQTFNAALATLIQAERAGATRSSPSTPRRRRPTRSTTTRSPGASASAAGSCPASTSTPTSATRRRAAWGLDWLRARHDAGPLPPARLRRPPRRHRARRRRRAPRAARRGRRAVRRGRRGAAASRPAPPDPADWPDVDADRPTRRRRHRRCSCPAPPSASRRTASTPTSTASTSPTSARRCRSTASEGVAHPGWVLRDANYVLSANVRLGPWIHVESVVQHLDVVADGEEVGCRGARHRGVGAQGPPLRASSTSSTSPTAARSPGPTTPPSTAREGPDLESVRDPRASAQVPQTGAQPRPRLA